MHFINYNNPDWYVGVKIHGPIRICCCNQAIDHMISVFIFRTLFIFFFPFVKTFLLNFLFKTNSLLSYYEIIILLYFFIYFYIRNKHKGIFSLCLFFSFIYTFSIDVLILFFFSLTNVFYHLLTFSINIKYY